MVEKSLVQVEKNMVKNLGSWIGQLTLARSKPIALKYMNIKNILVDAYPNKLPTILPIICKILECSKDSIFTPKSPWLKPIICVLEEIRRKKIKTSMQIEILLLFRSLGIDYYETMPVII